MNGMSDDWYIKNKQYDRNLYDRITAKSFAGEELTPEEKEYEKYCYHYEEWKAGLL